MSAILYVPESAVRAHVDQAAVIAAIERMFIRLARGESVNFPVVREKLGVHDAIFGFKSGFDRAVGVLGLKAGGLWPGNAANGLPNHQSTTLLFDPETGAPRALLGTTYLTALRTAAASALSIRALARADARTLAVIGAGGQAEWQIRAALGERRFTRVIVHDAVPQRARALADRLAGDVDCRAVDDVEALCRAADVLVTVTPALQPIVRRTWIRPGAHLACMGADTVGKQEVDAALVAAASLFTDDPAQAVSIGECQHAYRDGLIDRDRLTGLGEVLAGTRPGRSSDDAITLFDGTGVALQDLAAAEVALQAASAVSAVQHLGT